MTCFSASVWAVACVKCLAALFPLCTCCGDMFPTTFLSPAFFFLQITTMIMVATVDAVFPPTALTS
ncbi:T. brucei spp.-specific protein [Trypanosoma brucei gambiense DAL972]|uniref:T. brucei spp.-specific protein n=1 Tax=Trypanosoma brucei gambiense (strain MHOM/CI/86/DAL972) TaxID=679716 RepID=C9ZXI2_TRYB9|nr:T. brucei spp.-specific protein [Trypanosoma brucei gambiense DAL972]CBH14126.1 T. brucei spp.-specific protein [Trypanosoma brucei gambiense DAL972]|eukprot:XP_011776397.1 T. brucei spp.-specific protein [Trypanosoma brucei gambiense DAL972]